ncbi:Signal transduction histidine kinase [Pedobacter xixiisoli]|uniref:histidine kinase n=2 Tax=Pedobacter xixiisoli TaxID=1476464 RepID=A0A285ZSK6_9SPHI|nr:Signal transduction histidine kinase [Pedobacter xixiisoli]
MKAAGIQKITTRSGYILDKGSKWQLTAIQKKEFKFFREKQDLNIGYNKYDAVWCYFSFKNPSSSQTAKTWLCFDNYHIDSLTFFDYKKIRLLGDRTANQSPFLSTLAYEIEIEPGEEKIVWVRLKKQTSFFEFSYHLDNSVSLETKSSRKIALVAFFIGIAFFLLMINGILYLMTKKRLYIYYIGYSLLTVLYVMISTNFAKHLLFPQFLFFSEARVFTGALWYIALSYFLSCFLRLKENQFFKYKLISILCGINLLLVFLSIFFLVISPDLDFRPFFVLGYIIFMLAIVTLFWAAITHLKIERKQAIYALLAFAPQLIWGACLILKTFEVIPKSLGDQWMVYASLYEVFLFGVVLSRNYVEVFLRNSELMQEVIREKENSLSAINTVQLRERRNIANIIHDNVGSKIAYILHLFDMKNSRLAKETITELASDIRDISHKILPKALDEGALLSSLRSQIAILNDGIENTEIELFCYDFPERINEKWIYDIYLIALELINNAIKHGKAKLVTIEFYGYDDHYHFQFTDDGLGFNVDETEKGFGLENIGERIHHYKGDFEISSAVGQGTIVLIDIPIKNN